MNLPADKIIEKLKPFALPIIVALAAILRFYSLDRYTLWDDEARTFMASIPLSWSYIFELVNEHVSANPPLDPLLRYFTMVVGGKSSYVFTLPSVIFSIAGVLCYHRLARRLFGPGVAVITALLLAINPLDIFYAHEARNYAILNVIVPLSTLAQIRAVETKRLSAWALYSLSLIFAFYSHMLMLGLAVAHFVFVALKAAYAIRAGAAKRESLLTLRAFIISSVVAGFFFLPWVYVITSYLKNVGPWTQAPAKLAIIFSTTEILQMFNAGFYSSGFLFTVIFTVIGLVVLAVRRERHLPLIIIIIIVGWAVSYFLTRKNFFHIRYVVFLSPFFMIITAYGINFIFVELAGRLRLRASKDSVVHRVLCPQGLTLALLIVIFISYLPELSRQYRFGGTYQGNWREAAAYVNENYKEGDIIILPAMWRPIFDTYNKLPVHGFWVVGDETMIITSDGWSSEEISKKGNIPSRVHRKISAVNSKTDRHWSTILYNKSASVDDDSLTRILRSIKGDRVSVVWVGNIKYSQGERLLSSINEITRPLRFRQIKSEREIDGDTYHRLMVYLYKR